MTAVAALAVLANAASGPTKGTVRLRTDTARQVDEFGTRTSCSNGSVCKLEPDYNNDAGTPGLPRLY